jgi:hypothetical protein
MMKRFFTLSLALAAAATFGVTNVVQAADAPLQITLHEQNKSGVTGTATLTQVGDDLVVTIATKGGHDLEPVHIHRGTCANLGAVVYPLTTLHNGNSTTTVKGAKLSDLLAGKFAINAHKSATDIATYIACGDITTAKSMMSGSKM